MNDTLLDGAFGCKVRDENRLALTDAVHPVNRLVLDGRVPPPVKQMRGIDSRPFSLFDSVSLLVVK